MTASSFVMNQASICRIDATQVAAMPWRLRCLRILLGLRIPRIPSFHDYGLPVRLQEVGQNSDIRPQKASHFLHRGGKEETCHRATVFIVSRRSGVPWASPQGEGGGSGLVLYPKTFPIRARILTGKSWDLRKGTMSSHAKSEITRGGWKEPIQSQKDIFPSLA